MLLIKKLKTGLKKLVPKLLLKCSMSLFHNEFISPPDKSVLIGSRNNLTEKVIICNTMLRYIATPKLLRMDENHKIMCVYIICNTSKYLQVSLNEWCSSKPKRLKLISSSSHGRQKALSMTAYNVYADFVCLDNDLFIHVVKRLKILSFVHHYRIHFI